MKSNICVCVCVCRVFPLTASQAAAKARGSSAQHSAAASSITGMTVQEAQQILNISTLTPEEIQKVQTLCFFVNFSFQSYFLDKIPFYSL